tara:strand:- start:18575 stop:18832 length:258 start_codon:yes stop_codon:yes gene_type:complete
VALDLRCFFGHTVLIGGTEKEGGMRNDNVIVTDGYTAHIQYDPEIELYRGEECCSKIASNLFGSDKEMKISPKYWQKWDCKQRMS